MVRSSTDQPQASSIARRQQQLGEGFEFPIAPLQLPRHLRSLPRGWFTFARHALRLLFFLRHNRHGPATLSGMWFLPAF